MNEHSGRTLLRDLITEQLRLARTGLPYLTGFIVVYVAGYSWIDLRWPNDDKLFALASLAGFAAGYVLLVGVMDAASYFSDGKLGGVGIYVLAGSMMQIAIIAGLFALVLPGLYLGARWASAYPEAMIHGGGPIRVAKRAWQQSSGRWREIALSMTGAWACTGIAIGAMAAQTIAPLPLLLPLVVATNLALAIGFAWLTVSQIAAFGVLKPRNKLVAA